MTTTDGKEATAVAEQAQALLDRQVPHCIAGRVEESRAVYDEMRLLSEKYPHDPQARLARALGAHNLVSACGMTERVSQVKGIFAELRVVAQAYPDDHEFRLGMTRTILNLIAVYGQARRSREVADLCGYLHRLAEQSKDDTMTLESCVGACLGILFFARTRAELLPARQALSEAMAEAQEKDMRQEVALCAYALDRMDHILNQVEFEGRKDTAHGVPDAVYLPRRARTAPPAGSRPAGRSSQIRAPGKSRGTGRRADGSR